MDLPSGSVYIYIYKTSTLLVISRLIPRAHITRLIMISAMYIKNKKGLHQHLLTLSLSVGAIAGCLPS